MSKEAFMFAHGVDPETGKVVDKKSDLYGKSMKNKIFIFPNGKGSTTGSTWFLETIRQGNGPAAIVNRETEIIIATGAILGLLLYGKRIVIIDKVDLTKLKKLCYKKLVKINGDQAIVEYMEDN